jgi:prepilin-type N-terminal cleavage/methylation domain-containing protein
MDRGRELHPNDEGFTLVELLVVIIILGVLATITVFAVRGITDQGEDSAKGADEHTLVTAEEAHQARFNSYATEADLVSAGLLTSKSSVHDITLAADGSGYTIVLEGQGVTPTATTEPPTATTEPPTATTEPPTATTEPPTPTTEPSAPTLAVPTSLAGFGGMSFGSGSHRIVIISDHSSWSDAWDDFVAGGTSLATTEVIFLNAGDIDTTADVDAIRATGATYLVAPSTIAITRSGGGGGTFVGSYLDESLSSPSQFWWGHNEVNSLMSALDYYSTSVIVGG